LKYTGSKSGRLVVENDGITGLMGKRDKDIVPKRDATLLTPREIKILIMVGAGAENEEIAHKLGISPNTVRTHIYNIYKKINVSNRLQAVLWAAKNIE